MVKWLKPVALTLVGLMLAACRPTQTAHEESYVFGTRVELSVYGASKTQAHAAMSAVLQEFDRLHRTYHAWQPSELSRLNEGLAQGQTVAVSEEMAALVQDAKVLSEKGDDLFNPALGELIALWGFQSDTFAPKLPPEKALQAAQAHHPTMRDLVIEGKNIHSRNPAVRLDLGGYAKGYALDRAQAILREKQIENALINIGGNVMAMGKKGDLPWRVGLQDPRSARVMATLPLYSGEAIGTSGDYQRFFELDGVRYCHILDPRTGMPVQHTQSVTVLVPPQKGAGRLSDVASKPAFIIGSAKWQHALTPYGVIQGLHVDREGAISVTSEFNARLKWEPGYAPQSVLP